MKLGLIFLMALVIADCQKNLYSLNPRFYNAVKLNARGSFDDPLALLVLYQPSEDYESQYESNPENEIQPRNPFARLLFNYPGVYIPPNSGFGTYSPSTGTRSYNPLAGPFWLKTRIYTTYMTTTVLNLSYCIPASQFSKGAKNIQCNRRRRDILEVLDLSQEPAIDVTPAIKVETTALPAESSQDEASLPSSSLSSSKEEATLSQLAEVDLKRAKRLLDIFAVSMTVTSYVFSTSSVPKTVTLVTGCVSDTFSCLLCVPLGYGVC